MGARGLIFSTAITSLQNDDWKFQIDDEKNMIISGVQGKNTAFPLALQAKEETQRLLIYALCDFKIPEMKRLVAAEYFSRANYGIELGCFEIDMKDGEVRYKVSVDVEGGRLTPKMVTTMVAACASTMDNYYPGIKAISYESMAPETAIYKVEHGLPLPSSGIAAETQKTQLNTTAPVESKCECTIL